MAATDYDYDAVIVGLGETGYACAARLAYEGARVAVVDSRDDPPEASRLGHDCPTVPQFHGALSESLLTSAPLLVVSPGVDPRLPELVAARDAGIEIIGEIELFARRVGAR